MTDEMLALAQRNAARGGRDERRVPARAHRGHPVARRVGRCRDLELRDQPRRRQAGRLREIARVLRPGGRMGVTDIVAEDRLTAAEREERGSYVGCIAGALSFSEFRARPARRRAWST